jgi:hypothetical protein
MMEILGLLLVIAVILVGIGVYVFFKTKEDPEQVQETVVPQEFWGLIPENNVAPVATGTISLAPPPYPALNAKEAVALTIAKVAEIKQEPVVVETPVVEEEKVPPKPKAIPAAKKAPAKAAIPKPKKKK